MTQREERAMALRASNRFGYGPQPGELERIGKDPKGWLKAQLEPTAPEPQFAALPTTNAMFWQEEAWRLERTGIEDLQAKRKVQQAQNKIRNRHQLIQAALRLQQAAETKRPFRERLVRFWSNHFTVAMTKQILFAVGAPYEHGAIRHNLDGDFATLLLAAEQHPAMLIYLDNDLSTGPNSTAGKAGKRGLNENLGREIMELHTLSVH
ncbi:MAG TPA: DUF1800 family protein, partial [Hyphomicrobiales bacterium]|nr:DUF1800 family protein [Hyphomicrobiales bacterium]